METGDPKPLEIKENLSKEEIEAKIDALTKQLAEYALSIDPYTMDLKEKALKQDIRPFSHQQDQAYGPYLETKLEIEKYEEMLRKLRLK